ncbi:hypothetical protein LTR10_001131 [Elasticomyces elasticus]|nr:hypothetical protein LTR10_001131 [Elasticomyces elasticus]KAK4965502.1 hypothetical protein LTR42_012258 [Elasticomyces elasticus]
MASTTDVAAFELPARKKPKISALPLSSAQRSSIDALLHTFKKKGEFDNLRKKTFQQYNESAQRGRFEASLRTFSSNEIERDPVKYLKPDRRMGAPLLEGAAARGGVYDGVEGDIGGYIDQYLVVAERALRDLRRQEIGDEAAEEEEARGAKTEDAYAAEAEHRREERAKKFADGEKLRKRQEAQARKKGELEALRKKQKELVEETERLTREQARRAEREAWKVAEKQKERDRIQKFNEEREKLRKETEERERIAREAAEKKARERAEREQKRLEEEALDLLLREGKAMAEKGKRPELERSESMEPPPRLADRRPTGPRGSRAAGDEMRAQGLMPTSMTLRKGSGGVPTGPRGRETPAASLPRDDSRRRSRSPFTTRVTTRRSSRSPEDDRRPSRASEISGKRESLYRDISAERAAWKASQRNSTSATTVARPRSRARSPGGEEGEVVEAPPPPPPPRRRSRSREDANTYRPARRGDSRSPPRRVRGYREDSRSRSPPRFRRREDSPPLPRRREEGRDGGRGGLGRRERSRSPPGIDRYVPGGGGGGAPPAGGRRRAADDDRGPRRRESDDREPLPPPRRRDARLADIDRYVPGGGDGDKPRARRAERSRSRERGGVREADRYRGSSRERVAPSLRDRDSVAVEKAVAEKIAVEKVVVREAEPEKVSEDAKPVEKKEKEAGKEDVVEEEDEAEKEKELETVLKANVVEKPEVKDVATQDQRDGQGGTTSD